MKLHVLRRLHTSSTLTTALATSFASRRSNSFSPVHSIDIGHRTSEHGWIWAVSFRTCKFDSFRHTLSKVCKDPSSLRNHQLSAPSLAGVHPVNHQAVHQLRLHNISAAHPVLPPLPLPKHLHRFPHLGHTCSLWKLSSHFFFT